LHILTNYRLILKIPKIIGLNFEIDIGFLQKGFKRSIEIIDVEFLILYFSSHVFAVEYINECLNG